MVIYIARKLLYGLVVMAGVVTIVFLLFNVLPGDPARMMLGQRADVSGIEAINRELGRDQSISKQFLLYINDLSPLSWHDVKNKDSRIFLAGNKYGRTFSLVQSSDNALVLKMPYLRRSYQSKQNVSEIIADALPGTAILAAAALIFAAIVGIGMGILSALKHGTWTDYSNMIFAVLGMSVPSFFAGIIIAWLFGFVWSNYTGLDMTGSLYIIDPFSGPQLQLKNLILPALTLGIRPLAVIVQLTRSSMLEVMQMDYIRTARAKGLGKVAVVIRHALRNALNPVLTAISGWFGSLLAGAVFIEYIFNWKGIGKVTVDALEFYDFPVVMGSVLVVSLFFILINIGTDILYGMLDPRVRMS